MDGIEVCPKIRYEPVTLHPGISASDAQALIARGRSSWGQQAADGSYLIRRQMTDGRYLEIGFRIGGDGVACVFHAMPF